MRGAFLFSIISTAYALSLSARNNVAVDHKATGHSLLNKRGKSMVILDGRLCGSDFYSQKKMTTVSNSICQEIVKSKRSCPSNDPRCAGKNSLHYQGPPPYKYLGDKSNLYQWPITLSFRGKIGFKGKDRVIIKLTEQNQCSAITVMRKGSAKQGEWIECYSASRPVLQRRKAK